MLFRVQHLRVTLIKAQWPDLKTNPFQTMARIFDNIDNDLLTTLRATMQVSHRSDFCVGYLNLRGWQAIDDLVAPWDPAVGQVCRLFAAENGAGFNGFMPTGIEGNDPEV